MRWTAHGLVALVAGVLLGSSLVSGALAQVSDPESAVIFDLSRVPNDEAAQRELFSATDVSDAETLAIHGFRDELVQALRDAKAELARYRAYRDEPRWATIYDGWGYVDIERLADYVPIAQHVEDHPDALGSRETVP